MGDSLHFDRKEYIESILPAYGVLGNVPDYLRKTGMRYLSAVRKSIADEVMNGRSRPAESYIDFSYFPKEDIYAVKYFLRETLDGFRNGVRKMMEDTLNSPFRWHFTESIITTLAELRGKNPEKVRRLLRDPEISPTLSKNIYIEEIQLEGGKYTGSLDDCFSSSDNRKLLKDISRN